MCVCACVYGGIDVNAVSVWRQLGLGLCHSKQLVVTGSSCVSFGVFFVFFFVFFCVSQLYLWGSPLLGEIFAYVTVF